MTSNPKMRGMCSLPFSTARCCRRLISFASARNRNEPTWPLRIRLSGETHSFWLRATWLIWPIFSSRVILCSRSFTKRSATAVPWRDSCACGCIERGENAPNKASDKLPTANWRTKAREVKRNDIRSSVWRSFCRRERSGERNLSTHRKRHPPEVQVIHSDGHDGGARLDKRLFIWPVQRFPF